MAGLALLGLLATGCGGGDSDSTSEEVVTEESAPELTGEPIKLMTVTTLNAAGPTYQNIANTAKAYETYVNARGGIGGRQLR